MKKKVYREKYKITEETVQVVANAIVELADEQKRTIDSVVSDIVEESKPKKSKKVINNDSINNSYIKHI